MYKKILTKKFFGDNLVKELTAQQFVYAQIQIPKLPEVAMEFVRQYNNGADEEKEKLLHENNPDVLLKMFRGKSDYDRLHPFSENS